MDYDQPRNYLEEIKEAPTLHNARSSHIETSSTDKDLEVIF